jgi:hypothetical protein
MTTQPNIISRIQDFLSSLGPAHYVAPLAKPVDQYHIKDRNVRMTSDELNAMRPVIYGEISNRPMDKQALEANVIVNTMINRSGEYANHGQQKTIPQIISMPNQYQAYGGQQYKNYSNPPDSLARAKKQQVDSIIDNIGNQMKAGTYADTTKGAYYYQHHPDGSIQYDNTRPLFAPTSQPRTMKSLNTNLQ